MKRETRINLLLIAAILAVMIPGGIRLAQLAYTEGRGPSPNPTPARQTVAYMDPRPFDPNIPRVAPPATVDWLDGIARRHAPHDAPPPDDRHMSDQRHLELLRRWQADQTPQWLVILWHHRADTVTLALVRDGRALACYIRAQQMLALPPRVRSELLAVGYETAPRDITVMHLSASGTTAAPDHLRLLRDGDVIDTLALP